MRNFHDSGMPYFGLDVLDSLFAVQSLVRLSVCLLCSLPLLHGFPLLVFLVGVAPGGGGGGALVLWDGGGGVGGGGDGARGVVTGLLRRLGPVLFCSLVWFRADLIRPGSDRTRPALGGWSRGVMNRFGSLHGQLGDPLLVPGLVEPEPGVQGQQGQRVDLRHLVVGEQGREHHVLCVPHGDKVAWVG